MLAKKGTLAQPRDLQQQRKGTRYVNKSQESAVIEVLWSCVEEVEVEKRPVNPVHANSSAQQPTIPLGITSGQQGPVNGYVVSNVLKIRFKSVFHVQMNVIRLMTNSPLKEPCRVIFKSQKYSPFLVLNVNFQIPSFRSHKSIKNYGRNHVYDHFTRISALIQFIQSSNHFLRKGAVVSNFQFLGQVSSMAYPKIIFEMSVVLKRLNQISSVFFLGHCFYSVPEFLARHRHNPAMGMFQRSYNLLFT